MTINYVMYKQVANHAPISREREAALDQFLKDVRVFGPLSRFLRRLKELRRIKSTQWEPRGDGRKLAVTLGANAAANLAKLQGTDAEKDAELARLREALAKAEKANLALDATNKELGAANQQLKRDNEIALGQVAAVQAEKEREVGVLTEERDDLKAQLAALQQQNEELQQVAGEVEDMQRNKSAAAAHATTLTQGKKAAEAKAKDFEDKFNAANAEKDRQAEELAQLRAELAEATLALQKTQAAKEKALSEQAEHLRQLEAQATKVVEENQALKGQVAQLDAQAQKAEREKLEVTAAKEHVDSQLTDLQARHEALLAQRAEGVDPRVHDEEVRNGLILEQVGGKKSKECAGLFKSLSIDAGMGAIQHLRRGKLKGLKPVQIYQKYYDVFFGPDEPAEGRVRHFTDLDQNDARKMSGHMLIVYLFSTEGDITPQQKAIERNIESQSVQRMLLATLYHSLPPEHRGRVSHPITGGKIECRYRMVGSGNGAAAAADTKKNED